MSYDFELSRTRNDEGRTTTPGTTDAEQQATGTIAYGRLGDRSKDVVKRRLADLLIAKHPEFEEFQKDYQRIAQSKSITEAEARKRYGYIELTDDDGLQVTLFDNSAGVTMPFWPNPEKRLHTAWECLKILETEGLFSIYDRQLGKNLDLESDFEAVRASYTGANRIVDRTLRRRYNRVRKI